MANHIKHGDHTKTWKVNSDNDTWIVAEDANFEISADYGVNDGYHVGTTIRVLGDITIKDGGGVSAVVAESDGTRIIYGKHAHIDASASTSALQGNGLNLSVLNEGLIKAFTGLIANDGADIRNEGRIFGTVGIRAYNSGEAVTTIHNSGRIHATGDAIDIHAEASDLSMIVNSRHGEIHAGQSGIELAGGGNGRIINRGVIEGTDAVIDGAGSLKLINSGKIIGTIDLGAGNDILDLRQGSVKGIVYGGDGSDTYKVSDSSADLQEMSLGGVDTVMSSSTFTLGDNFEKLVLIGKGDIGGHGNELANVLTGNPADNRLFGHEGADSLSGAFGDDLLKGGGDADTFVFSTGFGKDVVDFQNGLDHIDLSQWKGVNSFADLSAHHLAVVDNNLEITKGADSLTLRNVDVSALDVADFQF